MYTVPWQMHQASAEGPRVGAGAVVLVGPFIGTVVETARRYVQRRKIGVSSIELEPCLRVQ